MRTPCSPASISECVAVRGDHARAWSSRCRGSIPLPSASVSAQCRLGIARQGQGARNRAPHHGAAHGKGRPGTPEAAADPQLAAAVRSAHPDRSACARVNDTRRREPRATARGAGNASQRPAAPAEAERRASGRRGGHGIGWSAIAIRTIAIAGAAGERAGDPQPESEIDKSARMAMAWRKCHRKRVERRVPPRTPASASLDQGCPDPGSSGGGNGRGARIRTEGLRFWRPTL